MHYLGLFNYFRDRIPTYADLAAPMESLRHVADVTAVWTPRHQASFTALKACLTHAPILSKPDFNHPFLVATDASGDGLGAVLYQLVDGQIQWNSFLARALHPAERNYSATKRELLGIVFALQRF